MNAKLFFLIHNERGYKRYYYQPLAKDDFFHRFCHETAVYVKLLISALRFPFDKRFNHPQYGQGRKSKLQIVWENICWTIQYKEVCRYYYLWGLDLKSRSPKDYVAYTEFRVIRNILNIRQRENIRSKYTFNYLALTRDKFCFGQYAKSLGFPVPETIALVANGKLSRLNDAGKFKDISTLLNDNLSAFCKECTGEGGSGAFSLDIKDGQLYINNQKDSIDGLMKRTEGATYIIQKRVANHPLISKIYPYSVNTLRVVTVLKDGNIHLFDARLRTGANGSVVDNACFGGVVIGINEDGSLMDWGYQEPGKAKDSHLVVKEYHPDTKQRFAGLKIPYWEEIIDTAKRFHGYYYGIPSIGWDIAITPSGPMILECGEDWEIQGTQIFKGGRRKDFYQLHGYALDIKLRKL